MEFRTKTDIIRDIEQNRKVVLDQARPRRKSRLKTSLVTTANSTRNLAHTAYSVGRAKLHELDQQLHAHTYGALSLALSAGAVAGVVAGQKLKTAISLAQRKSKKWWF